MCGYRKKNTSLEKERRLIKNIEHREKIKRQRKLKIFRNKKKEIL